MTILNSIDLDDVVTYGLRVVEFILIIILYGFLTTYRSELVNCLANETRACEICYIHSDIRSNKSNTDFIPTPLLLNVSPEYKVQPILGT